ncbi:MAG: hypothetical protein ACK41E_01600 [Deinococcales bacterium]
MVLVRLQAVLGRGVVLGGVCVMVCSALEDAERNADKNGLVTMNLFLT